MRFFNNFNIPLVLCNLLKKPHFIEEKFCFLTSAAATATLKQPTQYQERQRSNSLNVDHCRFDEALEIFHSRDLHGLVMDPEAYTFLLQGCIDNKAWDQGKKIHIHMNRIGYEPSLFQRNCLVNMYVKCRSLEDARKVFDEIPVRNAVSWSAMMTGYAQQGQGVEALDLFRQMLRGKVEPSCFAFGSALRACGNEGVLDWGKQIHAQIVTFGFQWDCVVGNVLLDMYAKCGSMEDASQVFDKFPERNVVSWNAIIAASSQHGYAFDAVEFFCQMQLLGVKPNEFTFASVVTACAGLSAMEQGRQIHVHAIKSGCVLNIFVGSALLNMYAKCGSPENARRVFDEMPDRNVVSWTALMVGYTQHNLGEEAIRLFVDMQRVGISSSYNSFAIVLSACAGIEAHDLGRQIHALVVKTGFQSDVSVGNGLVNMYVKCRNVEAARLTFDLMSNLDLISWNAMISGYTQNEHCEEALKHFRLMQWAGFKPDGVTLATVLSSCANLDAHEVGQQIHAIVLKSGFELDVPVGNALITLYAKCRSIFHSCQVFDEMIEKDLVSWNAMIGGYAQNELSSEAIELFQDIQKTNMPMNHVTFVSILGVLSCPETFYLGKQVHAYLISCGFELDISVENSLVIMYAKAGRMKEARGLFDKMVKQDLVSWNSMITGYALNKQEELALNFVCEMQRLCMRLDHFTFATVLRACASIAALEHGKEAHACIIRARHELDIVVGSALVDMYAKCGSIEGARKVFEKMADRNDVSWNAMISGYARHGQADEAFKHFDQMQCEGLKPSHITFIGVLSACSHAGQVDKGCYYFDSMKLIYDITPKVEHYACIVDLLSRAGQLKEAEGFIHNMPIQPNAFIWRILLGACRVYGNIEIGKQAARCLLDMDPQDAANYVLLSNLYASSGMWDDAMKVRTMMKEKGLRKDPGWSWIKLQSGVHGFLVGDRSHPQTEEIYAKLASLTEQMKEMGYVPDTNFVLRDVEQEHKEHFLSYHSEKLAIAFGLIKTPAGTPIRVIKNLRVCGDCHSVIKLISQIAGRKIVVRDANRYHHFINGLCSCGDYW